MKVNFTVSGVLSKRPVDFIVRRHLFLFFKEALHNCAKHSHATQVDINLEMDGSKLSIRVSDNGQGFDMKSLKRISGLKNMATRASRVGGHLDVQSAPGQGTVLDFRLAIYSRREGRLK
nr:ATP-binding protein [Ruficoccus amylovorans]